VRDGRVSMLAEAPAMTRREVGLRDGDEKHGRHWSRGRCWCGAAHDGTETGLTLVAPPWDASRDGEAAR